MEFIVSSEKRPMYQTISEDALKLRPLGLNYREIGKALGVNDKTARKAVECARILPR